MAVQITFKSGSQGGGSSGSPVQSADYADASNAVAAVSNGFLPIATPVFPDGSTGKASAYSVDEIHAIVTISAVTFAVTTA